MCSADETVSLNWGLAIGIAKYNAREFALSLLPSGLETEAFYTVVYPAAFIKDKFVFLFKNKESLHNFSS